MKVYMPISLDISGEILVIGGNHAAFKKIVLLNRYTENIRVVAPEISKEIKKLDCDWREEHYSPAHLEGIRVVYSCSENRKLDLQILKDAHERGILVNIHDVPELCDFVSPAIYRVDGMDVAVSSNARDVKKSIRWRNLIGEFLETLLHRKSG